jgi:primary-amine oxidase
MMKRFVRVLALVAVMLFGVAPAHAACPNSTETPITTVSRTFASGSSWSVAVNFSTCEGLVLGPAHYTPAGGTPLKVLHRASIAEVHVPYHTGTPRYKDVTLSTSGLGSNAALISAAECMGGTLFNSNKICVRNHDMGYGYKFQSSFRAKQKVEIFSSAQVGYYNYIFQWTFHDDGLIEPEVGLTGQLQLHGQTDAYLPYGSKLTPESQALISIGKSHMHSFYYRLDFDLGGGDSNAVSRIDFNPSTAASPDSPCSTPGQCGTNSFTQIMTEAAQTWSAQGQTSWLIWDKTQLNQDGRPIGYQLRPQITGIWRGLTSTTEPWTNAELWVTQYNACERYATDNTTPFIRPECAGAKTNVSAMVDGQSVNGSDLVIWYVQRLQHIPRDEDENYMPIEWTGFELEPRNLYHRNPSL